MLELRQLVLDIGPLQRLIEQLSEFDVVQGVVVEVDPLWSECWWINRQLGGDADILEQQSHLPLRPDWLYYLEYGVPPTFPTNPAFDFSWKPKSWIGGRAHFWQSLRRSIPHDFPPILVRVVLKAEQDDARRERADINDIIRNTPVPALLVERPRARLALASGDDANGSGGPGTIGGFLRDSNSKKLYAVTCGHVAGSAGSNLSDGGGQAIGTCIQSSVPKPNPGGQLCRKNNAAAIINKVDVALIDLKVNASPPSLGGWTNQFGSWQRVTMKGRQLKTGVTGAVAPFYRVLDEKKQEFCFENLFEVRTSSNIPIISYVTQFFSSPPQQGDSGSWIEVAGAQGNEWCGMLIAVDGQMGFAIEAESILGWALKNHGLNLNVP